MSWKVVGIISSIMSTFNVFVVLNIIRVIYSDFGAHEICKNDDCNAKVMSCKIVILFHASLLALSIGYLSGFITFDPIIYIKRSLGLVASEGPARGGGRYRPLLHNTSDELFELK
ncbi:hypothetical protein BMR1_03g02945 [Babesia microti strain RI]|uniref:Uncharacterized protein n=1 Tax=Babesia microti (strain RI) TaxID=1133968 RepID=A0A0K3AN88_BABMR|nr:hypothetical protein BMR1_03g02945 [Babesia microti strain RI]CTQ41189.1 hypothetical protein BMR1_03g02945 [Babesia microti strain RI]|eukprot:XP_012649200.1 hypothetical protein BMR1_03g02945 [Babesia microti strain RI]